MTGHPAVGYLRAALDRAQADAEYSRDGSMYFDCGDPAVADHYQRAGAPAAILAQVEADRELLAEHAEDPYDPGYCTTCTVGEEGWSGPVAARHPCRTLLLRAKAWGWKDEQHG